MDLRVLHFGSIPTVEPQNKALQDMPHFLNINWEDESAKEGSRVKFEREPHCVVVSSRRTIGSSELVTGWNARYRLSSHVRALGPKMNSEFVRPTLLRGDGQNTVTICPRLFITVN